MNPVSSNPLKNRQDMIRAAVQLIEPLVGCLSPGKARLLIGHAGANYSEDVAGMEGFSRVLWALVPMLAGKCPEAEPYWALWREGIINGTDPGHEEYWGTIGPFDQRMVEMAVMGMALCLIPDRFYHELTKAQQENLYSWLNQINEHDMPKNNWRFFRVLVNLGFLHVGRPVDTARLEEDLTLAESHYCADGWYFDKETQRDYYTLWGFHYYGLVYARVMGERDRERSERFAQRAKQIAPRFACWFDGEGRAVPYGRSMTYRFAQSCYFAALAFSGVKPADMTWGQIRHLLLSNIRFWMRQPVFDRGGVLTVGYGYPNLCISEGYNAPGSPYWAMKSFAVLALDEAHPFWASEEEAYHAPERFLDEQVRLLMMRDQENRMVTAYTAGNHAYEHMHEDEKYEKFAYSSQFAFSVVKEAGTLRKGAYDSMLAVKEAGKGLWHARSGCDSFVLREDMILFRWSPMEHVGIDTRVIPVDGNWHIRCHTIRTERRLEAAEGAFSVRRDWPGRRPCDRIRTKKSAGEAFAAAHGAFGSSAIYALKGYARGEVIEPECNTNLMHPRTVLPMLHAVIEPGTTELVCAVYCAAGDEYPQTVPAHVLAEVSCAGMTADSAAF
ncbi:MAG: DUF2264 domain-containing protein [Clostridia bacterium]|nr:DUF2264 domain-containing protein [Clostridia bacterium]